MTLAKVNFDHQSDQHTFLSFRDRQIHIETCPLHDKTICRSGRMALRIAEHCGSKPISNIRSASSSTTNVTRCNDYTLPDCMVRMSIKRPGVAVTICVPRFKSAICSATPAPPYTAVDLKGPIDARKVR
jgi:hypothetical protein